MDFSLLIDALPYIGVWIVGILSTLPFGKWILHFKGIPQVIAQYDEQIRTAIINSKDIPKGTKDGIIIILNWIKKLVEIQPINTSRDKSANTLKRAANLINGGGK